MVGAGRMGGALVAGWRAAGTLAPSDLIIIDPHPGAEAEAAAAEGARLNPDDAVLAEAKAVILAVKPQVWRTVVEGLPAKLNPSAAVISIMAGVSQEDITGVFGARPTARVMPTTAAAIRQGAFSLFAPAPDAMAIARALFEPLGDVVALEREALMHVATAVSGSAPAYFYAFIECLEAAGINAGLDAQQAALLARATLTGAAALLRQEGEEPSELRRQVTSPGGTTEAALEVLLGNDGLPTMMRRAVSAAVARSQALGRASG
jgi:pyrroline-5-carboxylate reductase